MLKKSAIDLFYTSCFIQDYEYELCIDEDEKQSLVSQDVVKELNLKTYELYRPYYIVVGGHRIQVTHYARVPISIGSYKEVVGCDVVPLSDVDLILGNSWLSKHAVRHNYSRTRYSFVCYGETFNLESRAPTNPKKVHVVARENTEPVKIVPKDEFEKSHQMVELGDTEEITIHVDEKIKEAMLVIDELPEVDEIKKIESFEEYEDEVEFQNNDDKSMVEEHVGQVCYGDESSVKDKVEKNEEKPEEIELEYLADDGNVVICGPI